MAKNGFRFFIEMLYLNNLGLASGDADDVITPINIFGMEVGHVTLRTAEMPP